MTEEEKTLAPSQLGTLRQREGETLSSFLEQFEINLFRSGAETATADQCTSWKEALISHLNHYSRTIVTPELHPSDGLNLVLRKLKKIATNRQHWATVFKDKISDGDSSASPPSDRDRGRRGLDSPSPRRDRGRDTYSPSPRRDLGRRDFSPRSSFDRGSSKTR